MAPEQSESQTFLAAQTDPRAEVWYDVSREIEEAESEVKEDALDSCAASNIDRPNSQIKLE